MSNSTKTQTETRNPELEAWIDEQDAGLELEEIYGDVEDIETEILAGHQSRY